MRRCVVAQAHVRREYRMSLSGFALNLYLYPNSGDSGALSICIIFKRTSYELRLYRRAVPLRLAFPRLLILTKLSCQGISFPQASAAVEQTSRFERHLGPRHSLSFSTACDWLCVSCLQKYGSLVHVVNNRADLSELGWKEPSTMRLARSSHCRNSAVHVCSRRDVRLQELFAPEELWKTPQPVLEASSGGVMSSLRKHRSEYERLPSTKYVRERPMMSLSKNSRSNLGN